MTDTGSLLALQERGACTEAVECVSGGEGSYTALIETALLDGQALPKQEHMVLLSKHLESIRSR